jgi:hypothetical protein
MAGKAKTQATQLDADRFLASSAKPADAAVVCAILRKVTGLEPAMWGPTIVGFGERQYELAGGGKGHMSAIGLSPRKPARVFDMRHAEGWDERRSRPGKHSTGQGCHYLRTRADMGARGLDERLAAAWKLVEKV